MDERLSQIITQSIQRLLAELEHTTPDMAQPLADWMKSLAGGYAPEAYFKHPLAFPTFLLPWWVEESLSRNIDLEFQSDLTYSSINGYYFIRMIDNVMDGDDTVERKLLPALAFFHTEFQTAYQTLFAPTHPFWALYRSVWFRAAQAVIQDARLSEIMLEMFEKASAQKESAALIPVAAACHRHNRPDLIEKWSIFVFRMSRWHQMYDDIFDWHKDSLSGNETYFLSEAKRLKQETESTIEWIIHGGFAHGCETMRAWMRETKEQASALNNPSILAYLEERSDLFEKRAQDSINGFKVLSKISETIS